MGFLSSLGRGLAKTASYAAAYNPGSLLFAAVLPREATARNYQDGVYHILTGQVGQRSGTGYNPTLGDAAKRTAGYFLPNYVYTPPTRRETYKEGTQDGHSPLKEDLKEAAPKLVALLVLGGAIVLASR